MYVDEIRVKDDWFIPHFLPREDRPIEMAMFREWKRYMSYEDFHNGGLWSSRLASHILAPIPGGQNGRTARVAATFALWCVMPVGRGFFDPLLRKAREENGETARADIALSSWAIENRLGSCTSNRLESLLCDAEGRPVYKQKPYPTLPDSRAVELTLLFFVSDRGRALLQRVNQSSDRQNWLPL